MRRRRLASLALLVALAAPAGAKADDAAPPAAPSPASPAPAAPAPASPPASATGPTVPDPAPWLDVSGAGLAGVSRDGKTVLFRMSRDGVSQVFRTGRDGGWPRRLTFRKDGVDFVALSPDGTSMVLGYDHDGDENYGLFVKETRDGAPAERKLLDAPDVQHADVRWAREGDRIYFHANEDDRGSFHLYEMTVADGKSRKVLDKPGNWGVEDVAPGHGKLLVSFDKSVQETTLHVLDLKSGALVEIDPRPAGSPATVAQAAFLGAGEEVLFLSERGGEWQWPYVARLSDGSVRALEVPPGDVDGFRVTPDGKTAFLVQNVDGRGTLRVVDVATGKALPGPDVGDGIASAPVTDDAHDLFFNLSRSDLPGSVVRWDAAANTLVPLTFPDMAGLPAESYEFVPRAVTYPTFDGKQIPAWLYLPRGREAKALPFVLQIHGGPTGQARPDFSAEKAYLLSMGFGVMAPNVRGSTGYGRAYRDSDDYKRRMDSVEDAKRAVDWLVAQGLADPKRIAVTGGSYGGFMVLALLTEHPSLFAAGAESVGISNFETFLENTASYRRQNRESEYGPLTDREFLRSISPIHKVGRITSPLLIAHGEKDPRVPVGEARQMEKALKDLKRPVEAIYFPDEGHGWVKRGNRRTYLRRLAEFLVKSLGPP